MSNKFKILFLGDIVGRPGRRVVKQFLVDKKMRSSYDLVIANVENASHGFGLTSKNYNELISVVKTHVCSKDGSDTVILFSSIMDKKDYLCSIVFYFLGYISHVWDFICSFVMYVADESGEDKGEGFDVTVAKTN